MYRQRRGDHASAIIQIIGIVKSDPAGDLKRFQKLGEVEFTILVPCCSGRYSIRSHLAVGVVKA